MAATWKAIGAEITLDGTTPKTLAGPPALGKTQLVVGISGEPDSTYQFTIRKNKGGVFTTIRSVPVIGGGEWPSLKDPIALDATDETLEGFLDVAGTPKVDVSSLVEQ